VGDDAHALGLHAQGDDLAGELVAGLLEGADGRHVFLRSLVLGVRTIAASMAIDRPETTAGAVPRSRDLDSTGGTFLGREEWRCPRGPHAACRVGWGSGRGRKLRRRCCAEAVEARPRAGLRPDQAI